MALRGAAAACNAATQTNNHPIVHSIPQYLRTGFHHSLSRPVRRFSPSPSFPYSNLSSLALNFAHIQLYPPVGTELKYPIRAVHEAAADPITSKKEEGGKSSQDWKIKMLYDGDCPLCMREVDMLRERNKSHGTIKFVDISSDEYSPEENQGLDYKTVMGRIHAILSDGTVVTDVEAFRRLYEQVGLGWVYAITKYEPIATMADAIYSVWAKYRLQITGRPSLEEILEVRKKKHEICSDSKACKM